MNWNQLGDRLTLTRTRLGLSRSELGRMVGVSHVTVINWEAGKRIYLDNWESLVTVLRKVDPGFDAEWLKYGKPQKITEPSLRYAVQEMDTENLSDSDLLKAFSTLSNEQKKAFLKLIKTL